MGLREIIDLLSQKLQQPLQPDSLGVYHFIVNERFSLHVERASDEKTLFLYAEVAVIPTTFQHSVLRVAMEGNLYGRQTGKGILGYDPQASSLIYTQRFPEDIPAEQFYEELEQYLGILKFWQDKVEDIVLQDPSEHFVDSKVKEALGKQDLEIYMA